MAASRRARRAALPAAALAAVGLLARPSLAQDTAAAEALFQAGKALLDRRQYADACPKLEASYAIDPTLGTLLKLADCHERLGLLARAWSEWILGANRARKKGEGGRADSAQHHVDALEPRLPRLQIVVRGSAPDLAVARDDTPVTAGMAGVDLPVDPGPHVVTVRRGDAILKRIEITATERSHDAVTVDLDDVTRANPPPPHDGAARSGAASTAPAEGPPQPPPPLAVRVQSTFQTVTFSLGLVGVLASIALESAALGIKGNEAHSTDCAVVAKVVYCNQNGIDNYQLARTLATDGQWPLIGGSALLATALVLKLTTPPEGQAPPAKAGSSALQRPQTAPWVTRGGGGVTAVWAF